MKWGQRWGDYWGDPGESISGLSVVPAAFGTGAMTVQWSGAHTGAWYKVYVDGCLRATTRSVEVTLDGEPGAHHVVEVIDVGPLNGDPDYDPAFAVGAAPGSRAQLTWDAIYSLRAENDQAGQLANWSVSGLVRSAPRFDPLGPRTGRLYVRLTDSGGQRTVDLFEDDARSSLVATGTRSGDGVVTLSESGGSGISGQVSVTYSEDDADIELEVTWAPEYPVYWDGGSGVISFAAPLAVLRDAGEDQLQFLSAALADGAYKFAVGARDEAGNESAPTADLPVTISTWPDPPTDLTVTYTGAGGYTLTWTDSPSPDVTKYRVYVSAADQPIEYSSFTVEVNPGIETYDGSGLSAAGEYRFAVRAFDGTYEERNTYEVAVELNAQLNQISPKPNVPHNLLATPQSGGDIRVSCRYDRILEQAVATEIRVYWDAGSGTIDFATPMATVPLVEGPNYASVSVVKGGLTDGQTYLFACKAATAGGVESEPTSTVSAVSDATAPPVPANPSASAARCL
jgi:hypothetical protein